MDFRDCSNVRKHVDIRKERLPVIQSQYSASSTICMLINGLHARVKPWADINTFYENIFDIETAAGWGLDNWGRILDRDRLIEDEETGYSERLDDEDYRFLLMYKALANICAADAHTLNVLNKQLFDGEDVCVIEIYDYGPMHIRYIFRFYLTDAQQAIFKEAGTLCKGAGVGLEYYAIDEDEVFGFDESGLQPFDQGIFDPVGIKTID